MLVASAAGFRNGAGFRIMNACVADPGGKEHDGFIGVAVARVSLLDIVAMGQVQGIRLWLAELRCDHETQAGFDHVERGRQVRAGNSESSQVRRSEDMDASVDPVSEANTVGGVERFSAAGFGGDDVITRAIDEVAH